MATSNSATLGGVVARNTGGGPALVLESSYMNAAGQRIININDLMMDEVASPPTAQANHAIIFAQDNGAGKTQLMVQFPTGAAVQIAIEP